MKHGTTTLLRPTNCCYQRLPRIDQKVRANYPHWGYENKGVWPKENTESVFFALTNSAFLAPSDNGSSFVRCKRKPNLTRRRLLRMGTAHSRLQDFEEFYYLLMGVQYPVTPLLITEHQWRISGIETPVIDQQIFEVLEEPFVWYEEPIVIEPEKTVVCAHRVVGGLSNFGNSTIAGGEKWRIIGSVVGQHHELIQQRQSIESCPEHPGDSYFGGKNMGAIGGLDVAYGASAQIIQTVLLVDNTGAASTVNPRQALAPLQQDGKHCGRSSLSATSSPPRRSNRRPDNRTWS